MKKTSFELVWEALVARPGMTTMEIVGEVSRSRARVRQALNRFLAEGRVCVSGYVYDFNRYVEKYAPGCRNAKRPSYGERDRFRVKKGKGTAISGTRARFDIWDGAVRAALRAAEKTAGTAAPEDRTAGIVREATGKTAPGTMKAGRSGAVWVTAGNGRPDRGKAGVTGAEGETAREAAAMRRNATEETIWNAMDGAMAGRVPATGREAACR